MISFLLTKLFHDFDLKKRFEFDGVRGLVIFREGISTLNIRSTLREPFNFISFCAINLLNFEEKKNSEQGRKEAYLSTFFIDSEGLGSLHTYP